MLHRYYDGAGVYDLIRDSSGDRLEEWSHWHANLRATRPATTEESALLDELSNETTIRDKATTALDANKTFLAITSPTNAQIAAQVKALTRQNNALIRLALRRFDGTD